MKSLRIISLLLFYLTSKYAVSQIPTTDVYDAFDELDRKLTLHFSNALDGVPIKSGNVHIENIGEFVTNKKGAVQFSIPESDGLYGVVFKKQGFITSKFTIDIQAGTLFFNRFSVSPKLPLGYIRIVLNWDKVPRDLDVHFVKKNRYHISYHNMRVSDDKKVKLDRDDSDGFGPETITVSHIDENSEYRYFVHDYSNRTNKNSSGLSKSKATVKVFGNNELVHTLTIPSNKIGNYWSVIKFVNSDMIIENKMMNFEPR